MKDLKYSALLDIYGKMLTDRQALMTEQYYNCDYSLAEIAENTNITRQAVHASLRQAQNTLLELEGKLGFYQKFSAIRSVIENAQISADESEIKKALKQISELI